MLVSWAFVKYYQDEGEAEKFVSSIVIIGLALTLMTIIIVPADIYIVSATLDSAGLRRSWATESTVNLIVTGLSICYYVLYSSIVVFLFSIIPFAYFFYEEWDIETSNSHRACNAIKYSLILLIILSILIVGGIFITAGEKPSLDYEWFKRVFNETVAERIFVFLVGVLGLLGMLVYVTYSVKYILFQGLWSIYSAYIFDKEENRSR